MNTKAELLAELKSVRGKIAALKADPLEYWLEKAQNIMEKMSSEFAAGKAFLDNCVEQVETHGWLISPIGRRRNLYRVFTGKNKYLADAGRRAKNSPIQGFSSELGISAGYLVLPKFHDYMKQFKKFGYRKVHMPHYCRVVHDASYNEVPYAMTIPYIHITQYTATYGAAEYYQDVFGMKFTVEPEIELEVSASADKSYKWSWELPSMRYKDLKEGEKPRDPKSLVDIIVQAVNDQVTLKQIDKDEAPDILRTIFAPWNDPEQLEYLQNTYPLLNVRDPSVTKQIKQLAKDFA